MSDSYGKYKEELQEYKRLCKLLKEKEDINNLYDHLEKLKKNPKIIYKDYKYQLKEEE